LKIKGWSLIRFLKPYRVSAVLAPLFMLLEVTMDLMQPRMVQRIVDDGIARMDLNVVLQTGLLMLGLALIGVVGGVGCGIFAETAGVGLAADLRQFLFRKVQNFSFANLDQLDTGQLITRLTNDVTQVQEAVTIMLRILVRSPLLLVGSVIMAIVTSPKLAFLPLILLPVELAMVIWVVQKATPLFLRVQERLDALNEVMQENLAGMRVVKAFVRRGFEIARFGRANESLTKENLAAGRMVAIIPSFMMLTLNMAIVAVFWFGGRNVIQGSMQVGQIIAFVNYLTTTLFSLMMVSTLVIQISRAEASAGRIQEVIDMQPAVQNRPAAVSEKPRDGRVVFENVAFHYNGDDSEPVLKEVTFSADAGQTVAILGTTGAGKTTLMNLIPRFYDVSAGRVLLDGVDVRDMDQETLRRSIGMVQQDVVLFSGTISDNIRYGRPDASDDEVQAAAQAAQAHDFIMSFPDGYDTRIEQRGANLSGGQKQRIAIARAILLQPAVLIFDDSTSAVDVETEVKIHAALDGMAHCSTRFMIAQRISTVLQADKILVLDDGRIAAQGTHRELLASSSIYRDIYDSQLGNGGVQA